MKSRTAKIERKSKETQIITALTIDGSGKADIKTPIGILDHMLELFAFHGFFDLSITVKKADLNVDIHHANEDIGIVLGKAFKTALGEDKKGIKRFGFAAAPMEATLCQCAIDVSGRGYLAIDTGQNTPPIAEQDGYAFNYLEHFLESFAHTLGATVNIRLSGVSADLHTNLETVFKALGIALDQATQIDPRRKGVPSTKGIID